MTVSDALAGITFDIATPGETADRRFAATSIIAPIASRLDAFFHALLDWDQPRGPAPSGAGPRSCADGCQGSRR